MSWLLLVSAILAEVCGVTALKLSRGFAEKLPSVLMFCFYGISFVLLTFAIKRIPVSVAYAVWSGIGTTLVAAIGFVYFREPVTLVRLGSIALIIVGVMGLNLSGSGH